MSVHPALQHLNRGADSGQVKQGQPLLIVLYEGAGATPFEPDTRFEITRTLLEKGYRVTAARQGGRADAPDDRQLLVLGRFDQPPPRDAVSSTGATVHFRSVEHTALADVVALVEGVGGETQTTKPGGWKPWFPVIDYSRCTNCLQCLSFCLFDVYGVSKEKQIEVQKASNCKTDCPACSRVCPEVAILFPKYKAGPINGDEVNTADLEREKMKVDISALLGGDIYSALRQRSQHAQSRFAKERDDARALEERKRCLAKLQQALDIPAEVLAALPSADLIRERGAQAAARAEQE
jgi:Pyruvate/2-oxoacid:ferredoxin oxidoreductase delta subunit